MNLANLTARLRTFAGFDLSAEESRDLLNEARGRVALRSKYPRKVASIGSTVSGQSVYDWPADLLLPMQLTVAGTPWEASDEGTTQGYANGELILHREGAWFDAPGDDGVRKLHLYPAPGGAHDIRLEWVFRPAPMVNDADEPTEFPAEFHAPALLPEVAAVYYETVEDNPELAQRNSEKADTAIGEIVRYDNMRRSGNGVFLVPVLGVTG